jgi:large subunit ribosomal protein L23
MSKDTTPKKPTPAQYEIVQAPAITEKSTLGSQHSQITFKVPLSASKPEIKAAVEALYKVKVKAVNTSILKGKEKRFKGILGRRSDIKKAIITLEAGQTIDISAAV